MKKLIRLYLIFFKLGLINFGGGYALLPLLQKELVDKYHWTTEEELTDYYAVGQCTPGAIAVNVSTFIGYKVKGVLGGIVATLGFITPALFVIFLIAAILNNFADNKYVQSAFKAMRATIFVLILSVVLKLSKKSIVDVISLLICLSVLFLSIFTPIPLFAYVIVAGVIGFFVSMFKEKKKKNNDNNAKKENNKEATPNEKEVV